MKRTTSKTAAKGIMQKASAELAEKTRRRAPTAVAPPKQELAPVEDGPAEEDPGEATRSLDEGAAAELPAVRAAMLAEAERILIGAAATGWIEFKLSGLGGTVDPHYARRVRVDVEERLQLVAELRAVERRAGLVEAAGCMPESPEERRALQEQQRSAEDERRYQARRRRLVKRYTTDTGNPAPSNFADGAFLRWREEQRDALLAVGYASHVEESGEDIDMETWSEGEEAQALLKRADLDITE